MHIILGIIGLATAAYFLVLRARRGAEMAHELLDVADDIRAAARRFGLRRNKAVHPAEDIDDPRIAVAGIGTAFIALDDLPTADTRRKLQASLSRRYDLSSTDAQELLVLGQWLVEQCGGAQSGLARLSRRLYKMSQTGEYDTLTGVLQDSLTGDLSERQTEALDDIKRAFGLR